MAFTFATQRPLVVQQLISFGLVVPGGAGPGVPISTVIQKNQLVTTFVVANPAAGSSVYIGGAGVQAAGANQGLEIQPGTSPAFAIRQEDRQLYELQVLLAALLEVFGCSQPQMEKIPFIVWDLSQLFLISANAVSSQVTVGAFPQPYL